MSLRKLSTPRWNEITAVFGGRFDPPHQGHREAVRGLFQFPGVKQVLVIPSGSAPHKSTLGSAAQRAKMTQLAFAQVPGEPFPSEVLFDWRELERAQLQPNHPTYSYDTLRELIPIYSKLAFVMGADQFTAFPSWHRFPEILSLCHWIILERKPLGHHSARQLLSQWEASGLVQAKHSHTWESSQHGFIIQIVPTEAQEISSTHIRESIARTGEPPIGTLLPSVLNYLKEQRLYGISKE